MATRRHGNDGQIQTRATSVSDPFRRLFLVAIFRGVVSPLDFLVWLHCIGARSLGVGGVVPRNNASVCENMIGLACRCNHCDRLGSMRRADV